MAEGVIAEEVTEATRSDPILKDPLNDNIWTKELSQLHVHQDELCVVREILLIEMRIAVPAKLQIRLLEVAHEGHIKVVVMKRRLRSKVQCPNMNKKAEEEVRIYVDCQMVSTPNSPEPMVRHALPNGPWWDMAVDIFGPTPWGVSLLELK